MERLLRAARRAEGVDEVHVDSLGGEDCRDMSCAAVRGRGPPNAIQVQRCENSDALEGRPRRMTLKRRCTPSDCRCIPGSSGSSSARAPRAGCRGKPNRRNWPTSASPPLRVRCRWARPSAIHGLSTRPSEPRWRTSSNNFARPHSRLTLGRRPTWFLLSRSRDRARVDDPSSAQSSCS